jgi:pimeloyl-ACP methyl ester carboxylesterase
MGPADAPGMKKGASWTIPGKPGLLRKPLLSLLGMGVRKDPEQFIARSKGSFAAVDAALLDEPDIAEAYIDMLREALRQGTRGAAVDASLYARPWGFSLAGIRIPVHLWHGVLDENVPVSVGRFVAEAIPGCRATFLEDERHLTLPRNHLEGILSAVSVGSP